MMKVTHNTEQLNHWSPLLVSFHASLRFWTQVLKSNNLVKWTDGAAMVMLNQKVLSECEEGRAVAQAISRRLLIAMARFRAQVRSYATYGGASGTEADLFRVFRFPLPLLPPNALNASSSIIRGWYNRPKSDRSANWNQSHTIPIRVWRKVNLFTGL
jgi:hypothetical protein